jgi:hypothetical protein
MTTLATDTFVRANSTGLGSNWNPTNSQFDVSSNMASCTNGDSYVVYSALGQPPNDQWAQCTYQTGISNRGGLVVRGVDSNNQYLMIIEGGSSPTLYKRVGGGFSLLASDTGPYGTAGDVGYQEIQGTTLKTYFNSTHLAGMDVTDSSFSSGYCGLRGFATGINFSPFSYGDFGSGGGIIVNPLSGRGGSSAIPLVT